MGLGYVDSALNCFENDLGTCVTDFVIDEIAGGFFDQVTQPIKEGVARTLGRGFTDLLSGLVDDLTGSGGVAEGLSVSLGETQTVYAPAECPYYSQCYAEILFYLSNR